MAQILGDRPAAVCREMTKVHEEFRTGTLAGLAAQLRGVALRGEVTLVVGGAPPPASRSAGPETLRAEVEREVRDRGVSRRDAARAVALRRGIPRKEVYRSLKGSGGEGGPDGAREEE